MMITFSYSVEYESMNINFYSKRQEWNQYVSAGTETRKNFQKKT